MTGAQLDIFAALDPEAAQLTEHQDDERARWAAERRRIPTHAEMLRHALRVALPYAYRLTADDLAGAMADENNTCGGTGPGCTQFDADRRGVSFTYYADELADPDALGAIDPTPEQAAALDVWRASRPDTSAAAWPSWPAPLDCSTPTPSRPW